MDLVLKIKSKARTVRLKMSMEERMVVNTLLDEKIVKEVMMLEENHQLEILQKCEELLKLIRNEEA